MITTATPKTKALCICAAFVITLRAFSAEWESLPPLPEPNGGFAAGTDGTSIYVAGGTNWQDGVKHWLRKVWRFNDSDRTWHIVGELPSPFAYGIAGTWINPKPVFLFAGGSDGENPISRIHWIENKKIENRNAEIPSICVLSAGGIVRDKYLVLIGGTHDTGKLGALSAKTWGLDLVSNRLTRFRDFPGTPFAAAASTVAPEGLYVFGGTIWDAAKEAVKNTDAAHVFLIGRNEWLPLKPMPYTARGVSAVSLQQGLVYLAGGYKSDEEGFSTDALLYDLNNDSYRKAKNLPYAAMVGLVKHDGFVYCLGGEVKQKHRTDKFFRIAVAELLK